MDNSGQNRKRRPITALTATICELMAIQSPEFALEPPLTDIIREANNDFNIPVVDKCLVYCPDAVGTFLFDKYRALFEPILQIAPLRVSLRAVFPPKTPVCFASMFTGAAPEIHGIARYERPVLSRDTFFDALLKAGKKVAIVAVADSSIDTIFRGRDIDYYTEMYDPEVTDRTLRLLDTPDYDFILVYHQEYDDKLHKSSPVSDQAIAALENHVSSFFRLVDKAINTWHEYNRAFIFAPDHGAHIDCENNRGDHGLDIDEDMNVEHFFGFAKGVYEA